MKVENVVYAPRKPSPKRRYKLFPGFILVIIPKRIAPVILMINVPIGKIVFDFSEIIFPNWNLNSPPKAPPIPTITKLNYITSLSVSINLSSLDFSLLLMLLQPISRASTIPKYAAPSPNIVETVMYEIAEK